jgi:hypothetical protein
LEYFFILLIVLLIFENIPAVIASYTYSFGAILAILGMLLCNAIDIVYPQVKRQTCLCQRQTGMLGA